MNSNPIIIQPAQNPNSGNIPFYSFNITLYPCQDAPPNGVSNSGLQHCSKNSFSNSYFPKGWTPTSQPPQITQNGKTISIPVPIPNSIYQCFQNFPSENINTYNNGGYTVQNSSIVPNFPSINNYDYNCNSLHHSYLNSRREFMKTKSIRPIRINSRIPPLPPPPPPQYFTSSRNKLEDFDRYNQDSERDFRLVNKTLLEDLKEGNSKRLYTLSKSNSCPQNHLVIPIPACNWRTTVSKGDEYERKHLEDRYSNKDENFKGGGDSPESYSPDNSKEKFSCDCTVCKDRFEDQKKRVNLQSSNLRNEESYHKSIPQIPSTVLWEQISSFKNFERNASKKLIDKSTCPKQTTFVDYDSSPVWEYERRDAQKFQRILSPSKAKNMSIQCDLDIEFPTTSTEILWCRAPKHSTPSLSEKSLTYRKLADKNDDSSEFIEFIPECRQRLQTSTIIRTCVDDDDDVDHSHSHENSSDYEEDINENSNREKESKFKLSPAASSTSSIVYQSRRPTFEEVMEYLEKADEQEKLELGFQFPNKNCANVKNSYSNKDNYKNSDTYNNNTDSYNNITETYDNENTNDNTNTIKSMELFKNTSTYSQLRREGSNSNIYGVKYEMQYKRDFEKVNAPKQSVVKRVKNYNQYQDSYTEVVCRRPPEEMFPAYPGPLDFPKNALGRVLSFLDSNYWQQVLDGFRLAVRLCRHHPLVLCEDLRHVVWKSEKHLASLKSSVSRAALACFTELILNVGKAMEPFVDKILHKILLKSMDCNKFLRWECRNVLNAIVYSLSHGKSLSCLETGFKHKSAMVRATISIMLKKWVQKVGVQKVMADYAHRIMPMIINLLQERGWEARAGAKDAFNFLVVHPNFMGVLRTVIPYEELLAASRRVKCIRELMEQDFLNFRI